MKELPPIAELRARFGAAYGSDAMWDRLAAEGYATWQARYLGTLPGGTAQQLPAVHVSAARAVPLPVILAGLFLLSTIAGDR